jgi:hypothetical protein
MSNALLALRGVAGFFLTALHRKPPVDATVSRGANWM